MNRLVAALAVIAALLFAIAPAPIRAQQNFRADMVMSGGDLDAPVPGVIYYNGTKVRLEITVDGMPIIMLIDPASGSQTMLMVEMRMYMQVPAGMVPVSPPSSQAMNADNPCATAGITGCVALGAEEVNGYATRGWQYTRDGEQWSSWISETMGFPVRSVSADGVTTDFSNISTDPIDPGLFEIPSDFRAMQGFPGD